MKKITTFCMAASMSILFANSSVIAASAPADVTTTTQSTEGKIIWADLYTGNVQASLDFYTTTFGWTEQHFGDADARYHLLYDGKQPIAGVIKRPTERNQTESALWIGSVGTDNVQVNVDKAAANNATVIFKPHDFALYGKRAVIADPQGGIIAFLDLDEQNQAHQNISNKWDWAQLFSIDTQKAADFYQAAFDFSVEKIANTANSFYLVKQQAVQASIVNLLAEFEQRDRWVNFVTVRNLAQTLSKATQNGAEIIYQPTGAALAIIADPNGALLGLTEQEGE
ncbi:VOC family protein [Pseudoalteromonas sp.]|uniref:VOC family protein n=1 Tax=Pseudoalteromonas sp. TaxID=53249 RepID=UPI003003380A